MMAWLVCGLLKNTVYPRLKASEKHPRLILCDNITKLASNVKLG